MKNSAEQSQHISEEREIRRTGDKEGVKPAFLSLEIGCYKADFAGIDRGKFKTQDSLQIA